MITDHLPVSFILRILKSLNLAQEEFDMIKRKILLFISLVKYFVILKLTLLNS